MKNFLKNLSKLFIVNNDLINKYETPKKLDDKSNRVFRFKFEGKKLDLNDVRIGDEVNFWYKPDTDFVHFYLSGYTLGDGYIGKILSKNLQKQYPKEVYKLYSTVQLISNNFIELDDNLKIINLPEEARKYYDKLSSSLLKRYTPKSSIKIGFKLKPNISGWNEELRINHYLCDEVIQEFKEKQEIDVLRSSIWIEGKNHEKISFENHIEKSELYRIVKVLLSNHKTRLSYIKKRNNQKYQVDSDVVYWHVDIEL